MRDPRYDILFEPVQIGPVTSRNRFYQTPQCNGMGRTYPTSMAVMRGVKAEGGWGVVFAEQCDFHYTSDNTRNVRLWDEQDIPILARMTDMVHEHGSLAGLMLAHNGYITPNIISRELPFSPSGGAAFGNFPTHTRAIDKADIKALHRWTRAAALNAVKAGFDIVNIYAAHDLALPFHFISRKHNTRGDEYGGSLENRVRLLRELIEVAKEAIGDRCAVGVRFSVDELIGPAGICADGEGREVVEMLAELPDIWDVNVSGWAQDSITSRFGEEGRQEAYVDFVKRVTTKPVVGVGRFTSPDTMVGQIRRGVLDMIGAARPSIADPFLPEKIRTGALEDIRECIGCNMCVTNNYLGAPIRCTQNPTMSEEWRRGWHPEYIAHKSTDDTVLIVGAGPAGLEAARAMGQRGYQVLLAEARTELGGRVTLESRLPGLSAWARVRDHRVQQIQKMTNVDVFLDSQMGQDEVAETECSLVAVATGSRWRRDGVGRHLRTPVATTADANVLTPDDIMAGVQVSGHIVIYDDDHFYMGSVVAEALVKQGCTVTILTPAAQFAGFSQMSLEIAHIQRRMAELGVQIVPLTTVTALGAGYVSAVGVFGTDARDIACDAVIMVAGQTPNDTLFRSLSAGQSTQRIVAIGDCQAPATIASAIFAGHKFARDLGLGDPDVVPFLREDVELSPNLSGWGAEPLRGAAE
ncbi:FAD-dependent oxidoreductase [uncultured Tateyamaria sp.]|uniref:oxidoreductase n=1 Tax=uncultured Tateyamaria sp. TaxID=455651 RepID=UPI0026226CC0|nr:FAD-dependent oxidoreductase [uncultured Tateyamaria sp.]